MTSRLYGGDGRVRIRQELLLGIGGFRALKLMGITPSVLHLNEGTVYTSLLRMQQAGWIAAEWGASENNRKAKFYSITKAGIRQLAKETEDWERISGVIGRVLTT